MTRIARFFDVLAVLSGSLILVGVLIMTADVVALNLMRTPLEWPHDLVQYLFLYSTFLAVATGRLALLDMRLDPVNRSGGDGA